MSEKTGKFLVSFRPGEVTGTHHERETELRKICASLGGFDCKVFDPYLAYSGLADAGLLVRVEEKSTSWLWTVSFFYPPEGDENEIRRKIINAFLTEAKNDPKLLPNGYAVVSDEHGNLYLRFIKKHQKYASRRTRPKITTKGG